MWKAMVSAVMAVTLLAAPAAAQEDDIYVQARLLMEEPYELHGEARLDCLEQKWESCLKKFKKAERQWKRLNRSLKWKRLTRGTSMETAILYYLEDINVSLPVIKKCVDTGECPDLSGN
jgi:hypothetical protein